MRVGGIPPAAASTGWAVWLIVSTAWVKGSPEAVAAGVIDVSGIAETIAGFIDGVGNVERVETSLTVVLIRLNSSVGRIGLKAVFPAFAADCSAALTTALLKLGPNLGVDTMMATFVAASLEIGLVATNGDVVPVDRVGLAGGLVKMLGDVGRGSWRVGFGVVIVEGALDRDGAGVFDRETTGVGLAVVDLVGLGRCC